MIAIMTFLWCFKFVVQTSFLFFLLYNYEKEKVLYDLCQNSAIIEVANLELLSLPSKQKKSWASLFFGG